MTPPPGTDFGPYRIEAPIGAGGMGSVYRARDTRLDRSVAVKIVEGRFTERFEREARTIASLNHPHICTLYDVGENYLVMEHIEGAPVAGPLPLNEVLRLGAQIADALNAAHRKGITHRDLKPGNILVSKAGAKVIDFGLAKAGPVVHGELDATMTKALTGEGAIVGTICYMSPEQLQGQEADTRSDIFALGCVLYEMLTGKRAFDGKSPVSIMAAILEHEPAPLSEVQPMTPAWLDRVIRRCLRKNPDERWQSAADIALELREPPVTATPSATATSKKWPWIAATALASALAAFAFAAYFTRQTPAGTPVRFEIQPSTSAATIVGVGNYPQISPDGSTVSFSSTSSGVLRLYVRSLAATEPKAVPHTEGASFGFFSPDGRSLAFRADGHLKKVDLQTGTVEILADWSNSGPPFGSWSSQGILIPGPKGLTRISAPGGAADVIIPKKENIGANASHPSFLPDGHRFLFFSHSGASGTGLYLGSIDEPNPKSPRLLWPSDSSGCFAAAGGDRAHVLFIRNESLMAQPVHARTLEPIGDPIGLLSGFPPAGSYLPVSASANGVLAYQSMPVLSVRPIWRSRKGEDLGEPAAAGPYHSVNLSPDGTRAAVTRNDTGNLTRADVWILDLVRKTSSRLTMDAAGGSWPIWTPDGEHVTFFHQSLRSFFTMPVAGGDRVELMESSPGSYPQHWSRDGKTLLYSFVSRRLDTYDTVSRKAAPLLVGQQYYIQAQGQFSPDGHLVAYSSDETGSRQVYVTSYPAGAAKLPITSKGGSQPRWRGDGRELFYVSGGKLSAVPIRSIGGKLEVGVPQELFDFSGDSAARNRYDVTADGQRFLVLTDPRDRKREPITVVLNWPAELNARRPSTP